MGIKIEDEDIVKIWKTPEVALKAGLEQRDVDRAFGLAVEGIEMPEPISMKLGPYYFNKHYRPPVKAAKLTAHDQAAVRHLVMMLLPHHHRHVR